MGGGRINELMAQAVYFLAQQLIFGGNLLNAVGQADQRG